jgi:hypothetical protein
MRSLESFSFFKVFKVCVARELDTDIQRSGAELEMLSRGRFVGKLAIDSVHTMKLILWEEGRENRNPIVCRKEVPLNSTSGT